MFFYLLLSSPKLLNAGFGLYRIY